MSPGIEHAIARTLLHFLWEGAGVAAALAAALWLGRRASAQARYAMACGAMAAMLAAFAGTLLWLWPQAPPVRVHQAVRTVLPVRVALPDSAPAAVTGRAVNWADWAVPVWLAGVVLLSLRSVAAWLAAVRLKSKAVQAAPAEWQRRFEALLEMARVSRTVALLESCLTEIPVVIGSLKPAILVPASLFTGFPPDHLELILLHELEHIRRHDYLVNLFQSMVEDVLFYHPAVWWVSAVMRAERENCCDDAAVRARGDARGVAEALAALEERRWAAAQAAMAANGGFLMNRIRRLLGTEVQRPSYWAAPLLTGGVVLAGAALLAPIGHARKAPDAPAAPVLVAQAVSPVAPAAAPQAAPKEVAPTPKTDQERKPEEERLKKELETPYKKWLDEEVHWIITADERTGFQKLNTDEEREAFIENFWLKRDPTPGTPENEFEEEYYRRIAYANENFRSDIPGWKTDRGMIYIKYGAPDERDEHPNGGTYQRPIEEGGGKTATYPFEKWRYRDIPGVGNNVTLEFVDVTLNGDYRLTADPATKDALLYVPGAGLTLYEQMGLADKSDRFMRTDGTRLGVGDMPLPSTINCSLERETDSEFRLVCRPAGQAQPPK